MSDTLKSQLEAFADRYRKEVEAAFREGYRAGHSVGETYYATYQCYGSADEQKRTENRAWINFKEKHGETKKQTKPESTR